MIGVDDRGRHLEVWLLLPWLANGRLTPAEREMAEEHVRACGACARELSLQREMCEAFAQPDTVVYAPGPSFRKLMERIDGSEVEALPAARPQRSSLLNRLNHVALWRPPGLAWAASFLLLVGMTGPMLNSYREAQVIHPNKLITKSDRETPTPNILHIALDRTLTIGETEELLRLSGARIVEGPSSTGVLGVTPFGVVDGRTPPAMANRQLRALAARLRTDPKVLWVQPLAEAGTDEPTPGTADRRAPDTPER